MCYKKNEDSHCCMMVNKEKIIPCAVVTLTIALTIAGFIIGHHIIGKGCCKKMLEELDEK